MEPWNGQKIRNVVKRAPQPEKTNAIDKQSLGLNANCYTELLGYQNITESIDCETFVHSATVAEFSDCTSIAKRFASQLAKGRR